MYSGIGTKVYYNEFSDKPFQPKKKKRSRSEIKTII